MRLSPDELILWQSGFVKINLTIATTWGVMLLLTVGSIFLTRGISGEVRVSRWQALLEILVGGMAKQLGEIGLVKPHDHIGFLGTLFVFIASANLLTILPAYETPTASLSTTAALAFCVFAAVPIFGIRENGVVEYVKSYFRPNFIMFPFHVISELTRTLALSVRLFGNMMSGGLIVAILLSITPFVFPMVMTALGLLTGLVQAYIFSILATVYIAAATTGEGRPTSKHAKSPEEAL